MTIEDLRTQADSLQKDVLAGIELMKISAARIRRDKAAHKRAMRYYINLKPRNNAFKNAMLDAMDKVA
jgi:hypothetical protein